MVKKLASVVRELWSAVTCADADAKKARRNKIGKFANKAQSVLFWVACIGMLPLTAAMWLYMAGIEVTSNPIVSWSLTIVVLLVLLSVVLNFITQLVLAIVKHQMFKDLKKSVEQISFKFFLNANAVKVRSKGGNARFSGPMSDKCAEMMAACWEELCNDAGFEAFSYYNNKMMI